MLQARSLVLGEDFEQARSGLYLPPGEVTDPIFAPCDAKPVGIDLFSGAGGFSCGFKRAGFHMAAAADGWATAAATYLVNLGGPETVVRCVGDELPEGTKAQKAWHAEHRGELVPADDLIALVRGDKDEKPALDDPQREAFERARHEGWGAGSGWIAGQPDVEPCEVYYLGDVRALTGATILRDLGRTGEDVAVVIGGPPCQGFSGAGKRNVMDPRNSLVFEFMRLVCEIRPQTFCMENVPGIASMVTPEGLPVLDAIARVAEDGGFGTYEAIKRALLASSGAGAAMRSRSVTREKPVGGSGARGLPLDGRDRFAEAETDDEPQLALEVSA